MMQGNDKKAASKLTLSEERCDVLESSIKETLGMLEGSYNQMKDDVCN